SSEARTRRCCRRMAERTAAMRDSKVWRIGVQREGWPSMGTVQRRARAAQERPAPKLVRTILSPSSTRPEAIASHNAIGIDAALDGGAQKNGSGAVAEEDAGAAIAPVQMERELVCADDEHAAGAPCLDLSGAHSQGVDEAGTSGVQVERAGPACPKPVLHQRGCGGHDVIGRAGGDDDE